MRCEHCSHCLGGQLPESYDEEWYCEYGFADPWDGGGCLYILSHIRRFFYRIYGFLFKPNYYYIFSATEYNPDTFETPVLQKNKLFAYQYGKTAKRFRTRKWANRFADKVIGSHSHVSQRGII